MWVKTSSASLFCLSIDANISHFEIIFMKITCHLHDILCLLSKDIIQNNIVHYSSLDSHSLLLRYSLSQIKAKNSRNVNSNEELEHPSLVSTFKRSRSSRWRWPLRMWQFAKIIVRSGKSFMVDDRFWQTFLLTTSLNDALTYVRLIIALKQSSDECRETESSWENVRSLIHLWISEEESAYFTVANSHSYIRVSIQFCTR